MSNQSKCFEIKVRESLGCIGPETKKFVIKLGSLKPAATGGKR